MAGEHYRPGVRRDRFPQLGSFATKVWVPPEAAGGSQAYVTISLNGLRSAALSRVVPDPLKDDEPPGLPVLGAAGDATGLEDAASYLSRQRPVGVAANLSLAHNR
jgi:hypothetical protein